MILLILLYLCVSRTHSLTLLTGHPPLSPAIQQSILTRENAPSNTRTMWNIIFNCFSTLFACTWIVVHPNIPAPGDSIWKILLRRMMIMIFVLLAPEMVIIWAARQHRDAKILAKKFQVEGRPGWTKTHAFFLIMGGFTLHAKGKPIRVLDWKDLETLAKAGRVDWPNITKEEIEDRSKSDYFAKGIVILQTTWFIVQFFARAHFKLTITELEVATLAFSTLIGVTYYLWWDKPLDVHCSVPVHLKELNTPGNIMAKDFSLKGFCLRCRPLPLGVSPAIVEGEPVERDELVEGDEPAEEDEPVEGDEPAEGDEVPFPSELLSSPPHVQDDHLIPTTIKDSPSLQPQADLPQRSSSSVSWMKRLHLPSGLIYVFVILPSISIFTSQFHAMMDECIIENNAQKSKDNPIDALLHDGPLRVPTFYSYTGHSMGRFAYGVCVSVIFGAMHCIAWYYEFSSSPERWGWRISSVIISVVPLFVLLAFTVLWRMGITSRLSTRDTVPFHILHVSFVLPYITSRIILLVFPLIALRALPSGAFAQVDWISTLQNI